MRRLTLPGAQYGPPAYAQVGQTWADQLRPTSTLLLPEFPLGLRVPGLVFRKDRRPHIAVERRMRPFAHVRD